MTARTLAFSAGPLLLLCLSAGTCATRAHTADERFKALDANRDGVITKYEYDSHAAFASMDGNHNNRISAEELEAVLGPQLDGTPSAADRIRVADLNGDGELTEEELRRAAEFRFSWLDSNQDGHVDLSEMRSGFGVHVLH